MDGWEDKRDFEVIGNLLIVFFFGGGGGGVTGARAHLRLCV